MNAVRQPHLQQAEHMLQMSLSPMHLWPSFHTLRRVRCRRAWCGDPGVRTAHRRCLSTDGEGAPHPRSRLPRPLTPHAQSTGCSFVHLNTCFLSSLKQVSTMLKSGRRTPGMLLEDKICLLYTSPSPRDRTRSRMPSSA